MEVLYKYFPFGNQTWQWKMYHRNQWFSHWHLDLHGISQPARLDDTRGYNMFWFSIQYVALPGQASTNLPPILVRLGTQRWDTVCKLASWTLVASATCLGCGTERQLRARLNQEGCLWKIWKLIGMRTFPTEKNDSCSKPPTKKKRATFGSKLTLPCSCHFPDCLKVRMCTVH